MDSGVGTSGKYSLLTSVSEFDTKFVLQHEWLSTYIRQVADEDHDVMEEACTAPCCTEVKHDTHFEEIAQAVAKDD